MTSMHEDSLEVEVNKIEVFTCDCYPPGEIVGIVKKAMEKSRKNWSLKEYNIERNPEEYTEALSRNGYPLGFKECINIFIDGMRIIEGKPTVEEIFAHIQ